MLHVQLFQRCVRPSDDGGGVRDRSCSQRGTGGQCVRSSWQAPRYRRRSPSAAVELWQRRWRSGLEANIRNCDRSAVGSRLRGWSGYILIVVLWCSGRAMHLWEAAHALIAALPTIAAASSSFEQPLHHGLIDWTRAA